MRVCGGVGAPVLEVKLAGGIASAELDDRCDPQQRLAVLAPEAGRTGTPAVRTQTRRRRRGWRGECAERSRVAQDPGGKAPTELAQEGGPVGVVEERGAVAIEQVEMDVHAVAGVLQVDHRREAGSQPVPAGDLADDLLEDDAAVGALETLGDLDGDLELVGRVLGEEPFGLDAGLDERCHHLAGERLGHAHRLQGEGKRRVRAGHDVELRRSKLARSRAPS